MEGPSIHYLEEKLQPFINKKIIDAYGNAHFEKEKFVGQTINDIFAFGKRLIIQLNDTALVTHFLMYGSYRIDNEREGITPRLALITKKHALFFYNCSVKCFNTMCIKKELPLNFDILSSMWDSKKIIPCIIKYPQESIDDILLDQEIFPGVGNIIKNEALALTALKPQKKVARLSNKKLTELAKNARSFSQTFLELYDNWPQFKQQFLVYGRKTCARCGAKIIRKQTGKRDRRSFFCPQCQK